MTSRSPADRLLALLPSCLIAPAGPQFCQIESGNQCFVHPGHARVLMLLRADDVALSLKHGVLTSC